MLSFTKGLADQILVNPPSMLCPLITELSSHDDVHRELPMLFKAVLLLWSIGLELGRLNELVL